MEVIRHRVPHRIRDVDDGGSRVNDGFHHLRQKIGFRAGGVLRGKLHFPAQPRGQGDALDGHRQNVRAALVHLVLAVNGGSRQNEVDAPPVPGRRHGLMNGQNVFFHAAGQTADAA